MNFHSAEIQLAVRELISVGQSFDTNEIREIVELMLKENKGYHDPIREPDVRKFLIKLFEKGGMPGYCLILKPMVGDDGPFVTFEFKLENPFTTVDLINRPKDAKLIRCNIHPYFKELIKEISEHAGCSQDQMIRSILIKSLLMIHNELK